MPAAVVEFVEATEPQKSYLTKLLDEKVTDPAYKMDTLFLINCGEMSKSAASKEIGFLLKQPKAPQQAKPGSKPMKSETGFYFEAESETVFQIVKAKTTGNLYAKKMVPPPPGKKKGRWDYAPGAMAQSGSWTMLTGEEAAALGKTWGVCCVCAAILTDPKSIEAGIGPICAGKF